MKAFFKEKKRSAGYARDRMKLLLISERITKQLEKDFGDAAYATIRGFVLKFETLGLLHCIAYGNRKK